MVRKVGGFTFQELNLTIDDIKATCEDGPDLSYDFITRPAYHHAFVTGDTGFLRLTLREAMQIGIDQGSLVHALQNHDEMTYELVHFATKHKDEHYTLGGQEYLGSELAEHIRQTLRDKITEPAAPYNLVFTQNGIACTTATIIAATLGVADPATATDQQVDEIRRGHLCWPCTTPCNPACSPCPDGISRGASPSIPPRCGSSSGTGTLAGSTAARTT